MGEYLDELSRLPVEEITKKKYIIIEAEYFEKLVNDCKAFQKQSKELSEDYEFKIKGLRADIGQLSRRLHDIRMKEAELHKICAEV